MRPFSAAASPGRLGGRRPTAGGPASGRRWPGSGTPPCRPEAAWVWICPSWAVPSRTCTAGRCRPAGTASRENRSARASIPGRLALRSSPVGCWWAESCGRPSRPRPAHSPAWSWSPRSGNNCAAPSPTGQGRWAGSLGSPCCCLHSKKWGEENARWRLAMVTVVSPQPYRCSALVLAPWWLCPDEDDPQLLPARRKAGIMSSSEADLGLLLWLTGACPTALPQTERQVELYLPYHALPPPENRTVL